MARATPGGQGTTGWRESLQDEEGGLILALGDEMDAVLGNLPGPGGAGESLDDAPPFALVAGTDKHMAGVQIGRGPGGDADRDGRGTHSGETFHRPRLQTVRVLQPQVFGGAGLAAFVLLGQRAAEFRDARVIRVHRKLPGRVQGNGQPDGFGNRFLLAAQGVEVGEGPENRGVRRPHRRVVG
jgi:hypothetical protein